MKYIYKKYLSETKVFTEFHRQKPKVTLLFEREVRILLSIVIKVYNYPIFLSKSIHLIKIDINCIYHYNK